MTDTPSRARIVGFCRIDLGAPSFLLPLFEAENNDGIYCQIVDLHTGRIESFAEVGETPDADLPVPDKAKRYAVGDDAVVAVLNRRSEIFFGVPRDMKNDLRPILSDPDATQSFKIRAYEAMGDRAMALVQRGPAVLAMVDALGSQGGRRYEGAILTEDLWEILDQHASNSDAKTRIKHRRPLLYATVNEDGRPEIEISSISPEDITIDAAGVLKILEYNLPGRQANLGGLPRADLSRVKNQSNLGIGEILEAISLSPRQEERLAILLRSIILHPQHGLHVLHTYRDKSAFANQIISGLRQSLPPYDPAKSLDIERLIARDIRAIISAAYPMRKGEIMYYLAAHLSDFDEIRSQIFNAFHESSALSVVRLQDAIRQELASMNRRPN